MSYSDITKPATPTYTDIATPSVDQSPKWSEIDEYWSTVDETWSTFTQSIYQTISKPSFDD